MSRFDTVQPAAVETREAVLDELVVAKLGDLVEAGRVSGRHVHAVVSPLSELGREAKLVIASVEDVRAVEPLGLAVLGEG